MTEKAPKKPQIPTTIPKAALHKMLDPKPLERGFQFTTLGPEGQEIDYEIIGEDEEVFLLKVLSDDPPPVG